MLEYMQWWSQYATRASHPSSVPTVVAKQREVAHSPASPRWSCQSPKAAKSTQARIAAAIHHRCAWDESWGSWQTDNMLRSPGVCDQWSSRLVGSPPVCLALCYTSFYPQDHLGKENTTLIIVDASTKKAYWCGNFEATMLMIVLVI